MTKKLFLMFAVIAMLVCVFAISANAVTPNNDGETFKASDGTVLALYDTEGKALAWFYDSTASQYVPYRVGIDFTMSLNSGRELLPTTKISDTDGDDSTSFPYTVSNMILLNGRDYKEFTYISGSWKDLPLQAIYVNSTFRWINKQSFNNNNSLRVFDIPKDHTGVLHIGAAFVRANALESFYIPKEAYFEGTSTFEYSTGIKSVEFHNEWTGTLKGYEFNGCTALVSIKLPSTITQIPTKFCYNTALAELTIPASVTSISTNAFANCAFESVVIPSGITVIDQYAFAGNKVLKAVTFLPATSDSISIKQAAFEGCTALEAIALPEGVTFLGNCAFKSCTALKSVTFPSTLATLDGGQHFYNTALEEVIGLENTQITSVPSGCFHGLKNWKPDVIKLPNTVTTIGQHAFADVGMKAVILGAGLTTFSGMEAFVNCPNLEAVYVPGTITSFGANTFGNKLRGDTLFFVTSTDSAYLESVKSNFSCTDIVSYDKYVSDSATYANGRHIISSYNLCDAFYEGNHIGESDIVIDKALGYFGTIEKAIVCETCGGTEVISTIAPIFTWKGYSAATYGTGYSVVQGFYVNKEAVDAYLAYAPDFNYGILATVNATDGAIAPKLGDGNVLTSSFDKGANDYLDIKVTGIPADNLATKVVFCVYVTVGDKMYYLDGGVTGEAVVGISYNQING